ncbi:MAG TPA: Do family serine endopeptidase [Candidatus Eisenbacteria bacterium]|jgi:Do/DeqQ family serine protease|nr:Do family serine endopeptidase [Candidatus Eisenbacteria bacterium]
MTIRRRALAAPLLLVILGALAPPALAQQPRAPQAPRPAAPAPDSQRLLRALEDAFVSVADRATPSVVNVSVKVKREARPEGGASPEMEERFREFFGPELFERFFRRRAPREEGRAAGSGVLVDPRGYILTNNHVVENATEIEVRLSDDRKFKATLVGRDGRTDLAVVKIENPTGALPVADLGDSDRLRVGQWAIAIGNPFGLDRTVTVGIISATGRTHVGVATYEQFIQTDASINPGNSGGPLLNLDGRVVGINTAIVSSGQGIGFAIPINMARDIMTQLINRGKVVRGWLGVAIQDLSPELAAGFGVKEDAGVLVADVMKDGPAAAGGLKPGDVIVEFGGSAIKDVPDLQKRVAAIEPGRAAPVKVMREKKSVTLSIKIGEQPTDDAMEAEESRDEILGLTVEPLTPETAQQRRLAARSGLLVTEVAPGSAGAAAGIRPGDAILEVNRKPVSDADAFRQAVVGLKPGESVPVYLQRGGGANEYVVLTAPRP